MRYQDLAKRDSDHVIWEVSHDKGISKKVVELTFAAATVFVMRLFMEARGKKHPEILRAAVSLTHRDRHYAVLIDIRYPCYKCGKWRTYKWYAWNAVPTRKFGIVLDNMVDIEQMVVLKKYRGLDMRQCHGYWCKNSKQEQRKSEDDWDQPGTVYPRDWAPLGEVADFSALRTRKVA
jgi:hypothetical protein